jgi:hypothetical protein
VSPGVGKASLLQPDQAEVAVGEGLAGAVAGGLA